MQRSVGCRLNAICEEMHRPISKAYVGTPCVIASWPKKAGMMDDKVRRTTVGCVVSVRQGIDRAIECPRDSSSTDRCTVTASPAAEGRPNRVRLRVGDVTARVHEGTPKDYRMPSGRDLLGVPSSLH